MLVDCLKRRWDEVVREISKENVKIRQGGGGNEKNARLRQSVSIYVFQMY
jgi:hypothetical protein